MKKLYVMIVLIGILTMSCICMVGCGDSNDSSFQETAIVDDDLITFTLTEKCDSPDGVSNTVGYKYVLKNKTDNKHLLVSIRELSKDDYMLDAVTLDQTLPPSKKVEGTISFITDRNEQIQSLDDVNNIQGVMKVTSNEDGGSNYRFEEELPITLK